MSLPQDGVAHEGRPQQAPAGYSPLIAYALRGLDRCWMPERGMWSHIYHLDRRPQPNESIPASDVFYSLNVLLGLSRLSPRPQLADGIEAIFHRCAALLPRLEVKTYAYGMALWASAELGIAPADEVEDHIHRVLEDRERWQRFTAQDIGMLLTGLNARIRAGRTRGQALSPLLFDAIRQHYAGPSALFYDAPSGWRRNFASFATQTYLTLACYSHFETFGDERALRLASACVTRLIELQGPQGEWPWFYFVPKGKVVDFYEVYSVHQTGMAPAFLAHAERHGVPGAAEALARGFAWVLGNNQLGRTMLRPELGMTVRSQARRGELETKTRRIVRSLVHAHVGPSQTLVDAKDVVTRPECRSYELGWILWSFGSRTDLPALTHAPEFGA